MLTSILTLDISSSLLTESTVLLQPFFSFIFDLYGHFSDEERLQILVTHRHSNFLILLYILKAFWKASLTP